MRRWCRYGSEGRAQDPEQGRREGGIGNVKPWEPTGGDVCFKLSDPWNRQVRRAPGLVETSRQEKVQTIRFGWKPRLWSSSPVQGEQGKVLMTRTGL